jgi:large subunit ribosomal protein L3
MKFILGEKIAMSQIFDKEGRVVPVTLVKVVPNTVLQVKEKEKDGYEALQLATGERKEKNIKKPPRGHFKNLGNFRYVKEFRARDGVKAQRGDKVDVSVFAEGDLVKVSGVSKAKGFQGVVKRHGFHGAPATHGTKHAHRQPGSIGATWPQRVIKGMRMAGRMGGGRISVKNLQIAKVDAENNLLAIKGALPGKRGTLLEIRG